MRELSHLFHPAVNHRIIHERVVLSYAFVSSPLHIRYTHTRGYIYFWLFLAIVWVCSD